MKIAIILGLTVGMSANLGWAASPPGGKPTKPAPACAAIAFRALPGGAADGEQTAGLYKSRLARLELRATVQNGAPANYYLIANGNRLAAAQSGLPAAAESCATAKKMPKPQAASASCTGGRFDVVVAHAGNQRYALLCRDYLRSQPRAADAYGEIKAQLAGYFPNDADAYYAIKDPVFDVLMAGAEVWAATTHWREPPSD